MGKVNLFLIVYLIKNDMKKTIMIWSVLALFAGSCTDDKDDVVIPPDLPDNDMNISIPDNSGSEEWVPEWSMPLIPECPKTIRV